MWLDSLMDEPQPERTLTLLISATGLRISSLASFLVRKGTDVKTVQKILRHSDVSTTLGIYAHSMSEDRLAAQDDMLAAMMTPSNAVN